MVHVQTSETPIDFSVARSGTNVVLVAEKKEIHVNKEFLSAFSPYFNVLLQSPNFAESTSPRVEIDHNYDQLLKCIQIIHGAGPHKVDDTASMTVESVEELLQSADRFDLPVVRRYCESELTALRLKKPYMAVDVFLLASQYNLQNKVMLMDQVTDTDWKEWCEWTSKIETSPVEFPPTHFYGRRAERQITMSVQDLIAICGKLHS